MPWLVSGSRVVEHTAHNYMIKGLYPAICNQREKMAQYQNDLDFAQVTQW